jgi:NifU-like protein involved in Fe-S cluster formation
MDDPFYREILMEYWDNPKNYGVMKNPDVDVTRFNPLCGDKVRIMAKVKKGLINSCYQRNESQKFYQNET